MVSKSRNLARPHKLAVEEIAPSVTRKPGALQWLFDFGRAAFGTVQMTVEASRATVVKLHLGEKLDEDGRIDRDPPGCVRYREILLNLHAGTQTLQVEIPPDERNTGPAAIRMPPELFEVLPFRYGELEASDDSPLQLHRIRQLAVFYPFNYDAAAFKCSDERLNRVWELSKYSIKATSFCGIYIDGDRERIPYEADAYINQLCHYGVDAEYEMARHSLEYLLFNPTWPTDWQLHCLPMAWADYQYTGRPDLLETYYDVLQTKALLPLAREDGLISTETGRVTPDLIRELFLDRAKKPLRDLVDWPPGSFTEGGTGERDNYDMVPVKTAINALHVWNLQLLIKIATVLEKTDDMEFFRHRYAQAVKSLHRTCFDWDKNLFVDGEGSNHSSLHANMLPAAFGLIPPGRETQVLEFIKSRGMACSVYGAQYLLEACYKLGEPDYAMQLMTAEHDRGWLNMLRAGSTVTLEAWDHKYKNNLDWNHAWGAAPANIIPRFLAGVRPANPGFTEALIAPQPGSLRQFQTAIPTPAGSVQLELETLNHGRRALIIQTPVPARLNLSGLQQSKTDDFIKIVPGRYERII